MLKLLQLPRNICFLVFHLRAYLDASVNNSWNIPYIRVGGGVQEEVGLEDGVEEKMSFPSKELCLQDTLEKSEY